MERKWQWHDTVLVCLLSGVLGALGGISHGVKKAYDFMEEQAMQERFDNYVEPPKRHYYLNIDEPRACEECMEA